LCLASIDLTSQIPENLTIESVTLDCTDAHTIGVKPVSLTLGETHTFVSTVPVPFTLAVVVGHFTIRWRSSGGEPGKKISAPYILIRYASSFKFLSMFVQS
jgi:hypothetical protein